MRISITAVSGNKRFTKALSRISSQLDSLRELAASLDTSEEPFDILQLVFMDRPPDHLKVIGTKGGDRLFQVQVGIPQMDSMDDHTLKHEVASRIEMALSATPLSSETKDEVLSRLE